MTSAHPARPGEIVHVWGTGFGPVGRVIHTGEPGPSSPPAGLLNPLACREAQTGRPVEVLFAGLAPGLVGFHQLDLRVPADAPRSLGVTCTLPEDATVSFSMPTTGQP